MEEKRRKGGKKKQGRGRRKKGGERKGAFTGDFRKGGLNEACAGFANHLPLCFKHSLTDSRVSIGKHIIQEHFTLNHTA